MILGPHTHRYCSMVCLATGGRPFVDGTLTVCLWTPPPVIHMMWGVWTSVMSGKRFTVLCPAAHREAPYLRISVSPDHENSHCSFEMSLHVRCVSWCRTEVPMISSIRRFLTESPTTHSEVSLTLVLMDTCTTRMT
jgi:hypothetical protein